MAAAGSWGRSLGMRLLGIWLLTGVLALVIVSIRAAQLVMDVLAVVAGVGISMGQ